MRFHAPGASRRLRNFALVARGQERPSFLNREPTFAPYGNGWTEVRKHLVNGALPSVRVDEGPASAAGTLNTLNAAPDVDPPAKLVGRMNTFLDLAAQLVEAPLLRHAHDMLLLDAWLQSMER